MDKVLSVVRSICWCFFKTSHPQSDKAAGKYQKVPNQPSLQLAENPASTNWNDGIDDFEDFDDNWDDLENPSPQVKPKSAPAQSQPVLNGISVPFSSPKQTLPKLQTAASAGPSKPQSHSPVETTHASPTSSASLSTPAPIAPIAPPPSHSSGPVGMSLVRPKKAETNSKRPAPSAAAEEPPKPVEADLFSDLGMAPTYKEPEKIKAVPKRVEAADPVASAFSQLDSLLEEATTAPASGNVGGWLNTQLDAGLGLDLSEEIAAVESESHSEATPQRSTRDVFDLTASAFDDTPAPAKAKSKPQAKDGHAHGLGAVAIDALDVDFGDDFGDAL